MHVFNALLNDEAGFVVSSELILIVTVAVIGLLVGLVTVRDQIVQELGDVAVAMGASNQSYSIGGVTNTTGNASTAGSFFSDLGDLNDNDGTDIEPAGIQVDTLAATSET